MAKGRRFYKKNNGQPGESQAEKQETNAGGTGNVQNNGKQAASSAKKPGGKPGENGGRKPGGNQSGNFNKRPGGKPFRKFNGKPGDKPAGKPGDKPADNRGKRPAGSMRERPQAKGSGRVLVACYSWSGVTAKAAQRIAAVAKGNSYRILPVKAYSSIYALCVAKAGMEKASGARPEIKGTLPDCSRYDKIAVGFPIWWFSCPMIIHSFLEKVKLEGKTVYPFCTSKTSGPKGCAADIRKTVPDATVKDCLDANKIDSMSDEDIRKWLEL